MIRMVVDLLSTVWDKNGIHLKGFEYFNPDDSRVVEELKHIKLIGVEAFSIAG